MGTIEYDSVTGSITVDAPDEWAAVVADLDRRENNNDHNYWRQDRRHVKFSSYQVWNTNDNQPAAADPSAEDQYFTAVEERDLADQSKELQAAIAQLPPLQQNLIRGLLAGKTQKELADDRGVKASAVSRQKIRAIQNLRRLMDTQRQNFPLPGEP